MKDMSCMIQELPDIVPIENIETKEVKGRSGTIHKFLGTYPAIDYPITMQLVDFNRLEEVKRWLRGSGQFILSNDPDKYYDAVVLNTGNPLKFENQLGEFWLFTVVFELQPLKRKVAERQQKLVVGKNEFYNHGTAMSKPKLLVEATGEGEIGFSWRYDIPAPNMQSFYVFKVLNPPKGLVTIDCALGLVLSDSGEYLKSRGRYPTVFPADNLITVYDSQSVKSASILLRSAYI